VRQAALSKVPMEAGVGAMAMMPLPTWIDGEGPMGFGISKAAVDASAKDALERMSGQPAYGGAFDAPTPFRNARGELIVVVHRSRMIGLVLVGEAAAPPRALSPPVPPQPPRPTASPAPAAREHAIAHLDGASTFAPTHAPDSSPSSEGDEGEMSALDRLKSRGRKRKLTLSPNGSPNGSPHGSSGTTEAPPGSC